MFFFFKQKTAYEMRISDWSSDVCSSDLRPAGRRKREKSCGWSWSLLNISLSRYKSLELNRNCLPDKRGSVAAPAATRGTLFSADDFFNLFDGVTGQILGDLRSEEHTSELQSLMRISYAVFCLHKKKHH